MMAYCRTEKREENAERLSEENSATVEARMIEDHLRDWSLLAVCGYRHGLSYSQAVVL